MHNAWQGEVQEMLSESSHYVRLSYQNKLIVVVGKNV